MVKTTSPSTSAPTFAWAVSSEDSTAYLSETDGTSRMTFSPKVEQLQHTTNAPAYLAVPTDSDDVEVDSVDKTDLLPEARSQRSIAAYLAGV